MRGFRFRLVLFFEASPLVTPSFASRSLGLEPMHRSIQPHKRRKTSGTQDVSSEAFLKLMIQRVLRFNTRLIFNVLEPALKGNSNLVFYLLKPGAPAETNNMFKMMKRYIKKKS